MEAQEYDSYSQRFSSSPWWGRPFSPPFPNGTEAASLPLSSPLFLSSHFRNLQTQEPVDAFLLRRLFTCRLTHSSNSGSSIRFSEKCMAPLYPSRLKVLLNRQLHGSGFRETYYPNGKFYRLNYSSDHFRVSKTGIFRAIQMQVCAAEKPSYEETTEEPLPEPRPFDLYRAICSSSDCQGSVVAMLEGWLNEGRKTTQWELNRIIKDLIKYKRESHALEVGFQLLIFVFFYFVGLFFIPVVCIGLFVFPSICMYV